MGGSLEVNFEDLPLLDQELSLRMARECEAGFRTADIFAVIVTDGELSIRSLLVAIVHDADIAATENGSLVRVVGNSELGQIETELLPHVQRENEGLQ